MHSPTLRERALKKLRHGPAGPQVFRIRGAAHTARRPALSTADARLVATLKRDAATTTSLGELQLPSNATLQADVARIAATLPGSADLRVDGDTREGRNTYLHCFSVDPPQFADEYPSILMWGLEPRLLDIVENYLGVPVAFDTVHLRKDIGTAQQVGTRIWHLDNEDQRVVRILVYFTDVDEHSGPFEYIPRRLTKRHRELHERALRASGDPILDDEMARVIPSDQWVQCTGPAGTVVIADNALLFHHGRVHRRERLALIYTYTSRHPRYTKLVRNSRFDDLLSERQRNAFFVRTTRNPSPAAERVTIADQQSLAAR